MPLFALLAVNVVLPQPLVVMLAGVPIWNVGSSKSMVSAVPLVSNGELSANMYVMDDGACVTEFSITSMLCSKPDVGAVTAVDDTTVTALMSVAEANVTATVRAAKSAA